MNKKIVKIIMVIIFTVIFKLSNVNAFKECYYDYGSNGIYIWISGNKVVGSYYGPDVKEFKGSIVNETCPSRIYFPKSITGAPTKFYKNYSDSSGVNVDSTTLKHETEIKENKPGGNVHCECKGKGTDSLGNPSKDTRKFYVRFKTEDYNLTLSKFLAGGKVVGDNWIDEKNAQNPNYSFINWAIYGVVGTEGTINPKTYVAGYKYTLDLAKNKCPEYVVISKFNGQLQKFLSNKQKAKDIARKVEKYAGFPNGNGIASIVACKEYTVQKEEETKPETNPEPEEKHYDDADVNMVVTPLNFSLDTYSCGNGFLESIPVTIPVIGRIVYLVVQILVPIILILLGSLDLVKSVMGQKEDEIKKNQQVFIKRLIGAALIFFVFAIVKFVVSVVSSDNSGNIMDCVDCIIRNSDNCKRE